MKNIYYQFSKSDIEAITYAMEIMPAYNFIQTEELADTAYSLSVSSGPKLILHQQLTQREIGFVALVIDCAFKALRDEMDLGEEALAGLQPYMFTINKLHPVFSPLLTE